MFRSYLSKPLISDEGLSTTQMIELGFVDKSQRVKVFEKECPSLNHIMVYDIKLSSDENQEDFTYSSNPDLQYNLRKGYSICEVYDPENFEIKKYSVIARKGPRKYYNIRFEDLTDDQTYFTTYDPNFAQSHEAFNQLVKDQNVRNYTFQPVFNSLENQNVIEVYKTTFTVGQNVQISYLAGESSWIIASQHATVFARSKEDLASYESMSKYAHKVPFLIAQFWLDYFETNITEKEDFIKGISGRTLCGTFVDNDTFNCILKFDGPNFVFHTVVQNNSDEINCLLPEH